ncbi:MAG: futalosine hydrolase [Thermodesulfovibrionales bacterium]
MLRGSCTGLLFAVPFEGGRLVRAMSERRRIVFGRQVFTAGRIAGIEAVAAASGIGAVNAAHAAGLMILAFRPSRIVLAGVAGAYRRSGLGVGDVAVADEEIYGDAGVRTDRSIDPMDSIGIPLVTRGGRKFFNRYPMNRALARKAVSAARRAFAGSHRVASGPMATVAACSGTVRQADIIGKKHAAVCENMEGAAVAQVCALYGVPLVEIRGVSNIAGIRDKKKWDLQLASEVSQNAVLAFLS